MKTLNKIGAINAKDFIVETHGFTVMNAKGISEEFQKLAPQTTEENIILFNVSGCERATPASLFVGLDFHDAHVVVVGDAASYGDKATNAFSKGGGMKNVISNVCFTDAPHVGGFASIEGYFYPYGVVIAIPDLAIEQEKETIAEVSFSIDGVPFISPVAASKQEDGKEDLEYGQGIVRGALIVYPYFQKEGVLEAGSELFRDGNNYEQFAAQSKIEELILDSSYAGEMDCVALACHRLKKAKLKGPRWTQACFACSNLEEMEYQEATFVYHRFIGKGNLPTLTFTNEGNNLEELTLSGEGLSASAMAKYLANDVKGIDAVTKSLTLKADIGTSLDFSKLNVNAEKITIEVTLSENGTKSKGTTIGFPKLGDAVKNLEICIASVFQNGSVLNLIPEDFTFSIKGLNEDMPGIKIVDTEGVDLTDSIRIEAK